MKRRLFIGIQDFIGIREDRYIYVDKIAIIYELLNGSGKTFFLSRPVVLASLCSTLCAIFERRRELFSESVTQATLAIDSLDWAWKSTQSSTLT